VKRRITLVVDDVRQLDLVERMSVTYSGVTIESVEDIPDPDRVQEFRVRVVTDPTENPWKSGYIKASLCESHVLCQKSITVTEVDPTEVER
jgi:hypothetical protein